MGKKKNRLLILFSLLTLSILMIFFIVSSLLYSVIESRSFQTMVKHSTEMIEVMRELAIENVLYHIDVEKRGVAGIADSYGESLFHASDTERNKLLKSIPLPEYGIDYIYVQKDSLTASAAGAAIPENYLQELERVFQGEITMIGPQFQSDDVYTLAFSAPVYENGSVKGALIAVLDGFCLSEWLADIRVPSGSSMAYLVDQNGTNIAVSTIENRDWVTTRYNAQELVRNDPTDMESKTIADLEILPLQGKTGISSYLWEGSRNYLAYGPVGNTGWGLYMGFYGHALRNYAKEITTGGFTFNQVFMTGLMILLCVLSILEIKWISREQRDNHTLTFQKEELTAQKEELIALQKKTEEQSNLLRESHDTIISSLEYAKKIQQNLLPQKETCKAYFTEFDLLWSPKDVVGGDLYWIKPFTSGSLLCVCDCTGHGVPGALLTMLVATALDAIVTESNCMDPAEIMWQLEQKLVSVLNTHVERNDAKINMMTIHEGADLALLYVAKDHTVTFSSGNTHLFVCNGTDVTDHKGQRLHIGEGSLTSKRRIETKVIPADERNRYYVASDGFFDQIGGPEHRPFGYRTFKRILLEHHEETAEQIMSRLWDAFEYHRGGETRRDDVELICFKP